MKYIDIHSHLNFRDFDEDRDEVINRCKEMGVGMINIGTGLNTSKEVVELANQNEDMWAIIGLHPIYVTEETEFRANEFQKLIDKDRAIDSPKIVGIGECGLDYYHLGDNPEDEKKLQSEIFHQQIQFAIKNDLPIMIHCRDAYDDVLDILRQYKEDAGNKLRGNCHFFAGTIEQAEDFLDLGFTVSFTGVITFAKEYEELVKYVPLELMHAETDSPYVAPVPFRGKRNEPTYVEKVVNRIADIKEVSFEEVENQLIGNAKRLFKL